MQESAEARPAVAQAPAEAGFAATGMLTGLLFLASGLAALFYQVAWQRALFGWYGVDLDSVSVIVSIFMLGLGAGALIGGALADSFPHHRVVVFALIELTIGLFGILSLDLVDVVGRPFAGASLPVIVLLTFVVFAIPTCAMGATLPVLVTELSEKTGNIGLSTGSLYFVNTFGAAFGALAAGYVVIPIEGLDGLVRTAALINFAVAAIAFLAFRRPK